MLSTHLGWANHSGPCERASVAHEPPFTELSFGEHVGPITPKGFRKMMEVEGVREWSTESCGHSAHGPAPADTAQPGTIGAAQSAMAAATRCEQRAVWAKMTLMTSTLNVTK